MWIVLVLIGAVLLYLLSRSRKRSQKSPLLKSVPGHFLLGNVKDFKSEVLLTTFVEFPRKYGPFLELFLLNKRLLLITDAVIGLEILKKRPKKFERLKVMDYSIEVLRNGSSLFNARGHEWTRIRKATSPSFSNLNLSHKVATVAKEIFTWIQHLKAQIPVGQTTSSEIDMKHEAFMVTVRVITVVAFGFPSDHPLVSYFVGPFQQDVSKQFRFVGESAIFPFPRWMWKYYPGKMAIEKAAVESMQRVASHGQKILDHKRTLHNQGQLENHCMVDTLILNHELSTEKALTDEEIMANIRTFYTAGADTTAITIAWATYYFATNPEYVQRVRHEARTILFAEAKTPEEFVARNHVDVKVFQEMVFTMAFLKELLRLRSPSNYLGHNLAREETEPFTLSNGITIEPDDLVYVNLEGMHHNEQAFPNPEEFNPNRWLTTDSKQLEVMEANFMPFGAGPRVCPGMGLAYQEATLALALLAYSFDFQLNCPPEEIQRIPTFVAVPTKMPIILSLAKE